MQTTPATADDSSERTFVATSANGIELAPSDVIKIKLYDGTVSGYVSCNEIGGNYRIVDGELNVDEMWSTAVACPPAESAQDRWIWSLLESPRKFTLNGPVLTIGDVELLDTSAPNPDDLPLIGTRWRVGLVVVAVPDGGVLDVEGGTIQFSADAIDVQVSCHHSHIPVTIDQDSHRITIAARVAGLRAPVPPLTTQPPPSVTAVRPSTTTPPPCDEQVHTEWEEMVLAVFDSDLTYEININQALLRDQDGLGVNLVAVL